MGSKTFYGWWIIIVTNIIGLPGFGTWLYSFGVFFKPMMAEFGWNGKKNQIVLYFIFLKEDIF